MLKTYYGWELVKNILNLFFNKNRKQLVTYTNRICIYTFSLTDMLLYLNNVYNKPGGGGGGDTWPMFGYKGAAEGLKPWPCLGQKKT